MSAVDAVIAEYANEQPIEAKTPEPEVVKPEEASETEAPEVEKPEESTEDGESKEATEDEEPFPKKAKNTISRLKKSNARKNSEIKQLHQKLAEYEQLQKKPEPKEDDFSNWTDYQDARAEHRLNVKIAEKQVEDVNNRVQAYEAEEESARVDEINEMGEAFEREHPAAAKMIADNMSIIASLPPHVKRAIQLADNPPMVLHNLLQEGKLQYLPHLPPERAAIEIGKADAKPIPPKPQTKAPTPMTPARANVNPGFNWQAMSADDLLKSIRKG